MDNTQFETKENKIQNYQGQIEPKFLGGGELPNKRLMGMCCWMGPHFHDWSDYNGVAFQSIY